MDEWIMVERDSSTGPQPTQINLSHIIMIADEPFGTMITLSDGSKHQVAVKFDELRRIIRPQLLGRLT